MYVLQCILCVSERKFFQMYGALQRVIDFMSQVNYVPNIVDDMSQNKMLSNS